MKQLRELAIVSKIWNNSKRNLSASSSFLPAIIPPSIAVLILISLIGGFSIQALLYSFIIIVIFDTITLYLLGKFRLQEISKILTTINSIRDNKFSSPDEIRLDKNLVELEGEIKAMFLRTQNDIANLKKLEHVRTEFLGNVSHELRTPIFAMQGYLETLLGGAINDPKVNQTFLMKANHHTQNLNNLLNDLIDISMIESGQMRMSFRYFNVSTYLENIVNEMIPLAEEKNLQLNLYEIRPNLQLFGDKDRIKQVLVNLISNAIKYTEEGNIDVAVEEESKFGRIIIKDTGPGITDSDLDRIFERFYRVDKDRSRAVGGTGLGLAIVKHIIDAHSSKIEVKSKLGQGSEFSFKLKK